jgi:hypothetical protein
MRRGGDIATPQVHKELYPRTQKTERLQTTGHNLAITSDTYIYIHVRFRLLRAD